MRASSGSFSSAGHVGELNPYYICAPDVQMQEVLAKRLWRLCSELNALGYQAYLESGEVSGELWTPLLTESTRVAHYKAGKKPIVVSATKPHAFNADIGLQVRYLSEVPQAEGIAPRASPSKLQFVHGTLATDDCRALLIPSIDAAAAPASLLQPASARKGIAYVNSRYIAAGGQSRDFGADAINLSADKRTTQAATRDALCKARLLYLYEPSELLDLARLCGCPVVLVPNAFTLKTCPKELVGTEKCGVAWGDAALEVDQATDTVLQWREDFLRKAVENAHLLQDFVQATQQAAADMSFDSAWPTVGVDKLDIKNLSPAEQGGRSDRNKYRRLNEQFEAWSKACTIREIDADIYAEHLASGKVPPISVLIDHRGFPLDSLADTLDSLAECLWQPAHVLIVSELPVPEAMQGQSELQWLTVQGPGQAALQQAHQSLTEWVLLVQSGTRLAPQSLVEWGLATGTFAQAQLIYADDAVWQADGPSQYPFFKPDANIELLRNTNYLGNALLARCSAWAGAGYPLFDGGIYRYALDLLQSQGRQALAHIDTVLVHATGALSAQAESQEFDACKNLVQAHGLAPSVRPLERLGTWLVEYASPAVRCVSLVVPTAMQTGYMRSLLESLARYPQEALAEVLLVCQPEHRDEVEYALASVKLDVPIRVLPFAQVEYQHGAALNAGIAQASAEFVLVCDDDTEALHAQWLSPLLGIAQQADVACVAPRLMSNRGTDARVTGGPLVLGVQACAAPYNGETGLLDECGVQSRLQLTQDVSAVAGHCFLLRRADWSAVQGFDVSTFGMFFTVLDFCLRQGKRGKRHVWTPLANVLHQGGKTVETLARDLRTKLKLADTDLTERDNLLRVWSKELANDPCYNRHLSLFTPFDIEQTIVVDWQPRRKDRPRVLACPLTSGAGQYRVIEPLNALQDASLAQTCVIIPYKRRQTRVLQPLELVRAAPDRLILQHSVDDAQFGLIDKYRLALPGLQIIQMVDDLLGEVPEKHPNRNFQVREGHQRMARALKQSDRLVVTTDPLREHYKKYVPDVWLVPNCLDKQWSGLRLPKGSGHKLRVGWIGAGQHKGDLELITNVVRALADEVDWVFMGMCTDEIKPHIKEFHDFVSISDYPRKMSSLDLDIAIAPLENNFFNECKSNLRLLEYGAMGWPVVCSDVFPYRSNNPPVMRCGNDPAQWIEAIRTLMADDRLRLQRGDQLHQWVQANYLLKDKAGEWMRAIFDESAKP